MECILEHDRQIIRELAKKKMEYGNSQKNEVILKKWEALGNGKRETPTVRLLLGGFGPEVIEPRLRCEGETARAVEAALLRDLAGRELFDDDTPISPTYDIQWDTWIKIFGADPILVHAAGADTLGYHIEPVIKDLDKELDKLRGGCVGVDKEKTKRKIALAEDLFGDILPVRMVQPSFKCMITKELVHLMGMENYYLSMCDCPDALHEAMDMATTVFEKYCDLLEDEKLLLPTCGISPLSQESFAFNHELPTENVTKSTQCWGFLESQETTAVSPEMYGEFVYPYHERMVKRFGLLSYGCCERVDALWPDYLSKWEKLRKLSVSPFNNLYQVGEYLRGSNVVYYCKPRAEYITNPGPLDENALREYFKGVCHAASGCLFEIAQREAGTIYGDYNRGRRYVEIAKECVERYWQP